MDTKYHFQNPSKMESKLDESGMVRDLPFAICHKVCMLLNNTDLGNSYKMLAGVMGYEINAIKTFGLKDNPAENLLQDWGTRGDSTNGKLIKCLARIQRSDVIDVLYGRESRANNQEPREVVRPNMRLPMVRDMEYLLRYSICLALNLPQISGSDYRMFAAEVGISKPELTAISRKGNPMEEVLTWWAAKNEATVDKMKGILLAMGREDVWEMLENSKAEELNLQRAQSAMADERTTCAKTPKSTPNRPGTAVNTDGQVASVQVKVEQPCTLTDGTAGNTDVEMVSVQDTGEPTVTDGAAQNAGATAEEHPATTVFISYNWGIKKKALELKVKLEEKNITCSMDVATLKGGDDWKSELEKRIKECKVMLSCLTKAYSKSSVCKQEVGLAEKLKKPIIPLIFEEHLPPELAEGMGLSFSRLLYINCINGLSTEKINDVLKAIRSKIQ